MRAVHAHFFEIRALPAAASVVRNRKCLIRGGYAYVSVRDVHTVAMGVLRRRLQQSFDALASKQLEIVLLYEDERIGDFLRGIPDAVHASTFGIGAGTREAASDERLSLANFEAVYRGAFPPCMHFLTESLKKERHLKHSGRLQLWLFLKGAGMRMEEQLDFWRSRWRAPEEFEKEHAYNIRHAYGLEGKRTSYPAFPCSKIINNMPTVGPSERHGCPFKVLDPERLKKYLRAHFKAVDSEAVDRVAALAGDHQYQIACKEVFTLAHPGSEGDGVGNHPNAFFSESMAFRKRIAAAKQLKQEQQQKAPQQQQQQP
eukprot:GHVU01206714.1.p1 GENE.GHVU01206714.1~~GHVU01206714.1.p1  ORF type:complete len:330 (-),score=92.41 GHVU01206714.1:83-1027(-)